MQRGHYKMYSNEVRERHWLVEFAEERGDWETLAWATRIKKEDNILRLKCGSLSEQTDELSLMVEKDNQLKLKKKSIEDFYTFW